MSFVICNTEKKYQDQNGICYFHDKSTASNIKANCCYTTYFWNKMDNVVDTFLDKIGFNRNCEFKSKAIQQDDVFYHFEVYLENLVKDTSWSNAETSRDWINKLPVTDEFKDRFCYIMSLDISDHFDLFDIMYNMVYSYSSTLA